MPAGDLQPSALAHRTINSLFLRAEALAGLGRYAEAVAAYRTFLEQRPQVSGVVEERIADAWLAAGEWAQAANALHRAASAAPVGREKAALQERLVGALQADGRLTEAASVYDEIIAEIDAAEEARAQNETDPAADFDIILGFQALPAHRVGILYRAGSAFAAAGEEENAILYWRMALNEAPLSNAAYLSLVQLVNRNEPVDHFLRGEIDLYAKAYIPAIDAFERFIEASPQDARAGEAWLGIARSQMGMEQWDAARLAINQALGAYPDCVCVGDAWLARAQLASAQGSPAAARRVYRTFARDYPDDPLAPQALWLSALSSIAADTDLDARPANRTGVAADPFDEAVADLLRLEDSFPDSQQAADGLALAGIGAFARGRYAQAANNFARLRTAYPDAHPGAAAYWLGRARHTQGEADDARALWQELAARAPETYYGVLAGLEFMSSQGRPGQDIVSRMGATVVAAAAPDLPDDDGSRAFAENWLAGWHGAPDATIASDADLFGGELLLALGLRAQGLKLLERGYWRYRDDPAALFPLMLHLDGLGANRLSISAAHRLIQLSPARRTGEAPLFLQRAAYPRHFFRLVEKEAKTREIDPLLLYSLILQESLFEPPARSSAGAHGLTQIIPSTGAEIAQRLSYPNYSTALLNRPFINVQFGAYYLRWVRDYAGDNDVASLAGYNAGPGNAKIWLDRTAPDDALFTEFVPYAETRLYLQRILTHYYHYLRIYSF